MINTLTRSTLAYAQFLHFRRFEINVHNIHPLCALRTDAKKSLISSAYNEVLAQSTKSPSCTLRRWAAVENRPGKRLPFSLQVQQVPTVLQWYGHPRVLGIPIPKTPVIWVSPVALTLTQIAKVISEGDVLITRVLGMGMPKTRACPYHTL